MLNLDRMLLHSAPIARGWNVYMGSIRKDLKVSPVLRELAICAIARLNDAPYEWFQHAPEFLSVGGTQAKLDALDDIENAHVNTAVFNTAEIATLLLTREMSRHIKVSQATLDKIRTEFTDIVKTGIFELTAALPEEHEEAGLVHLPRLKFRFHRHKLGRLRQLIDVVNRD